MRATCQKEAARSLGKYTLMEALGEGYLGPVYRAFDCEHGRHVAVRLLSDGIRWDDIVRARFVRECQAAANLQHPNIAAIFDIGQEAKSPYIVTELLEGTNLGSLIAEKAVLPVEKKLSIMIQVAEGLNHAHTSGVLHRDLRPAKVHLTTAGTAKIRDFGIASVLARHLARPGIRFGLPLYLSPEQIDRRDCDERSDVFSTGIVFYELLTFAHPFHDQNSNKAVDRILFETHLPTIDRYPDVPPGMWAILKRCLAKKPDDRYQTMSELSGACRDLLKDLSDDSQLMLAELQSVLPRLRKAAEAPYAPAGVAKLLHDIQALMSMEESPDYVSLDRLMEALAEQYPVIQAFAATPPVLDGWSPPTPQGPTEVAAPDQSDTMLPPSDETALQEPEICSGQRGAPALAASDCTAPENDFDETVGAQRTELTGEEGGGVGPEVHRTESEELIPLNGKSFSSPLASGDTCSPASADESNQESSPVIALPVAVEGLTLRKIEPGVDREPAQSRYIIIPQPRYRTAAALLAILLIVVAVYVFASRRTAALVHKLQSTYAAGLSMAKEANAQYVLSPLASVLPGTSGSNDSQNDDDEVTIRILLNEARDLAAQRRFAESDVLVRRVLEMSPANESALSLARENGDEVRQLRGTNGELREGIARVSALMASGMLKPARVELDRLQQVNPDVPELLALRRKLESRNSEITQSLNRKAEEQREAARLQKDEERAGRVAELFSLGKYREALGASNLWMAEDPASTRARHLKSQIEEAQLGLAAYESAMAERKYQDALAALRTLEQVNPADPNLAALRRQVEARTAAARATLTVQRLGARAALVLDGKPVGNNGELDGEIVTIGSHTLAIVNQGSVLASRSQEFIDGQNVVYVYDPARRLLRPIADGERILVEQRKAMEEVHSFAIEHYHGLLRGSCSGVLSLDYFDVEFIPASGSHGFHMPFARLDARIEGKSVIFSFASDGKDLQNFRVKDAPTALDFKQTWDKLKALGR